MAKVFAPTTHYRASPEELKSMLDSIGYQIAKIEHELQTLVDWYGHMTDSPYIDQVAMDQMKAIYTKQFDALTLDYHKCLNVQSALKALYESRK